MRASGKYSNLQLNIKSPRANTTKGNYSTKSNPRIYRHVQSMLQIQKRIYANFKKEYSNDINFYNVKIINEIICNETTHIVAEFKDYLISGDYSEFLQKFYTLSDSKECLPKIFDYYESCSVIFPNYVILPESKYIYKNIQRKQRVIDNQQEIEAEMEKKKNGIIVNTFKREDRVFDTQVFDSILNQTDTSTMRALLGMPPIQKKDDEDSLVSNDSVDSSNKIINMIEEAELNPDSKKAKVNISLKKQGGNNVNHKGRNAHRDSYTTTNYSNNNLTSRDNKTYQIKNNKAKKTLLNTIMNYNKDLVSKAFKELNIKKYTKTTHSKGKVSSPNQNNNKKLEKNLTVSKSNNLFTVFHTKNNLSMPKLSQIQNLIPRNGNKSKDKKSSGNNNNNNNHNIDVIFKNDLPLTSREPNKLSINPEIMQMLNTKITKMKTINSKKTSSSISHKKTVSSSAATATGSYNNKNYEEKNISGGNTVSTNNQSKSKNNNHYISVTQRSSSSRRNYSINYTNNNTGSSTAMKELTKTNSGSISVKSYLAINNKLNNGERCSSLSPTTSNSSSNKVLKTYTHFQSHSTLIGNNTGNTSYGVHNSNLNTNGNSKNKKSNIVIPIRRDFNIKGIQIKGFDELLSNGKSGSRNSNSERMEYGGHSVYNRKSKNNFINENGNGKYGYYEMFRTTTKKK